MKYLMYILCDRNCLLGLNLTVGIYWPGYIKMVGWDKMRIGEFWVVVGGMWKWLGIYLIEAQHIGDIETHV